MTRRTFATSTLAASAAAATPLPAARPKKIAAIMNVLWEKRASHARSIIGKCLFGYNYDSKPPGPGFEIASMFTHQTPESDISRDWSRKTGVPVFPTIYEALTLGGKDLAVDGVRMIHDGAVNNRHTSLSYQVKACEFIRLNSLDLVTIDETSSPSANMSGTRRANTSIRASSFSSKSPTPSA